MLLYTDKGQQTAPLPVPLRRGRKKGNRGRLQSPVMTWHACVWEHVRGSPLWQSISVPHQTDRPLTQHHKGRKPFQSLPYFSLSVRWQKAMIDLLFSHGSKGAERSYVSLKKPKKTKKRKKKMVACVTTSFTTLLIIFINNTTQVLLLVVMQLVCLHACESVCAHTPHSPMNFISVPSPL